LALFEVVGADDPTVAPARLALANALFGQRGYPWTPAFLDALATDFGAGLRAVDFEKQTEAARKAINGFVSDVTRDTIRELIGPNVLTADTRLALVNALYLKAAWADPFQPSQTTDGSFTITGGRQVRVPFMHHDVDAAYTAGPGWRACRLDYVGPRLSMTLVLPDAGRGDLFTSLDGSLLRAILADDHRSSVQLALPKWRTRSALSLQDVLSRLGMPTAFSDRADFSGMTTREGLKISAVVHQGYIAVDEAGTEASASTAVIMRPMAALDPQQLTFDRPFLYVLHDRETRAPLFIGRVSDPSS
jgi:serpin B